MVLYPAPVQRKPVMAKKNFDDVSRCPRYVRARQMLYLCLTDFMLVVVSEERKLSDEYLPTRGFHIDIGVQLE